MKKRKGFPVGKKIKYLLDNFISKGFFAQILLLAGTSVLLNIILAFVGLRLGEPNYIDSYWTVLMHLLDQGTITAESGRSGEFFRFMLVVTFVGMAITGTIIALITTAIQSKLALLRKGHSAIFKRGHVLILGFDGNACAVYRHIDGDTVIADNLPKEDMEAAVREYLFNLDPSKKPPKMKVLLRSGAPSSENTLAICAAENAKAIFINAPDDPAAIHTLMAVVSYLRRQHVCHEEGKMPFIVAYIRDSQNLAAAKAACDGESNILLLDDNAISGGLFARICAYQGLSLVCDRLFAGVHVCEDSETPPESSLTLGAAKENGELCPADDSGRAVYLLEDAAPSTEAEESLPASGTAQIRREKQPKHFLIIGQSSILPELLSHLADCCAQGSSVCLIASQADTSLPCTQVYCPQPLNWQALKPVLDAHPAWFTQGQITNIITLSDDSLDGAQADEKLMLLLLNMLSYHIPSSVCLTAQLNLPQNQKLLQDSENCDFVITNALKNRITAQILQQPIKYEILKSIASRICLYPVESSQPFTFEEAFASARPDLPIGWLREDNPCPVLNPTPQQLKTPRSGKYKLIVLAKGWINE